MHLGIVIDDRLPSELRWQATNEMTDPLYFESQEHLDAWTKRMQGRLRHSRAQTERMLKVHTELLHSYGVKGAIHPKGWMVYGMCGLLEKYLKWALADLFARLLNQTELPKRPSWAAPGLPWTGGVASYIKRKYLFRKRGNGKPTKKAVQFGYSLYQSKGGSLPVPDEFVTAQMESMEERVLKERKTLYTDQFMDDLIEQCERTVDEIMDDLEIDLSDKEVKTVPGISKVPSLHSSFQSFRSKMGTQAWIFRNVPHGAFSLPVLLGHSGDSLVYGNYDPDDLEHALYQSRLAALNNVGRGVKCEPVPLLEPFKVRVITRGDADNQHLSRRWQPYIHSTLRKHPNLQLIGGPIGDEALKFLQERSNPYDGRFWVSGDYESATDNLDPDLSEAVHFRLAKRLGIPAEDTLATRENLTRHLVKTLAGRFDPQLWGQFMGSSVSFPVLCIINLAATRYSLELANGCVGDLLLKTLALLVNGDDVGFRANNTEYTVWKAVVEACGLKPSIGKNYTSDEWLILNSQLFQCRVQEKGHGLGTKGRFVLRRVPIKCSTLLFCRDRSSAVGADMTPSATGGFHSKRSMAACAEALIEGHKPEVQKDLIERFVRINGEELRKRPQGMPLYTPQAYGGFGIPGEPDPRFVLFTEAEAEKVKVQKIYLGETQKYTYEVRTPIGYSYVKECERQVPVEYRTTVPLKMSTNVREALGGAPQMEYMKMYLSQLEKKRTTVKKAQDMPGLTYFLPAASPVTRDDIARADRRTSEKYKKFRKAVIKYSYQGPLKQELNRFRLDDETVLVVSTPHLVRMKGEDLS
jgi:hypothetical protein